MGKKNYFKLSEAKKYLNKKGLELFNKSNQKKSDNSFKNLMYTCFLLIPSCTLSMGYI